MSAGRKNPRKRKSPRHLNRESPGEKLDRRGKKGMKPQGFREDTWRGGDGATET